MNNTYTRLHTYIESTVVTKPPDSVQLTLQCITLILIFAFVVYMFSIVIIPICIQKCKRRENHDDLLTFDNVPTTEV